MSAALQRLPIILFAVLLQFSCNRGRAVNNTGQPTNNQVESLIKTGKRFKTANIDSLLQVAQKLALVAQHTGSKTALVYDELYTSFYYWQSADPKQSMEIAVQCLADAGKWGIKRAYPEIYQVMGNLHKENKNYKMAFDAQDKGLKWAETNHDTGAIISMLSLRAMFIHEQNVEKNTLARDTSINIQLVTLKMAESNKKYDRQSIVFYDNIAQYYLDNGDYDKAIDYGDKGAALALKYNQQRSLTYSYSWLGTAWFHKGYREKGIAYLNQALRIAHALKEPYREMEIYGHLRDCYYLAGDYKTAITLLTRSDKMRDSLQVANNEKQTSELQIKYESAQKDKELALRERQMIIILAGTLLFLIFSIVLFLLYRAQSHKNRIIKNSNVQKDKALESIAYIQAHELRRPLASIMGLINVIKAMDHEVDKECLLMLDEASKELDGRIRAIIAQVEKERK